MFAKTLSTIGGTLFRLFFLTLGSLFLFIGRLVGEKPSKYIDLSQLPTEADLASLASWLARHRPCRGELTSIHAVDGYLCCVAVDPKVSMPGDWIGLMFNNEPLPKDFEPMLAVMGRHMNDILNGCQQEPSQYRLLCQTHPKLDTDPQPLQSWCQGFAIGMQLHNEDWQAPYLDTQGTRWVESVLRAARASKVPRLQPHTVAQGAARLARRALRARAAGGERLAHRDN